MSVNLITYNAAITALSKASRRNNKNVVKYNRNQPPSSSQDEGLWTRVVMLLQQMKEDGIQPDGFSFTSAISCCGAEGRWEEALGLMAVMKKGGPRTRPNKIAYTAAICKFFFWHFRNCCIAASYGTPYTFMELTSTETIPTKQRIAACGRAGETDSAIELFRSMKSEGLSADGVAYNALFSALRIAGRADMVSDESVAAPREEHFYWVYYYWTFSFTRQHQSNLSCSYTVLLSPITLLGVRVVGRNLRDKIRSPRCRDTRYYYCHGLH
jgi:pentatricopeptide repeat protein